MIWNEPLVQDPLEQQLSSRDCSGWLAGWSATFWGMPVKKISWYVTLDIWTGRSCAKEIDFEILSPAYGSSSKARQALVQTRVQQLLQNVFQFLYTSVLVSAWWNHVGPWQTRTCKKDYEFVAFYPVEDLPMWSNNLLGHVIGVSTSHISHIFPQVCESSF